METNHCGTQDAGGETRTKAAFFDLDNTLIGGDSDYLWGEHLSEIGAVDAAGHRHRNEEFLNAYHRGTLDVEEFLAFQLAPLRRYRMRELEGWRAEFIRNTIAPLVLPKAVDLLARHRRRGESLVIITSTNRFITEPIARLLEVDHLLATDPEVRAGRFTGRVAGPPCSGEGKVTHAKRWAGLHNACLGDAFFYTDSSADLPLMEAVGSPRAVDPDEQLGAVARRRGWPILTLR